MPEPPIIEPIESMLRTQFSNEMAEFSRVDLKKLVRVDLRSFRDSNFDDISVYFDLNYMWIEALRKESLDSLPDDQVAAVRGHVSNLKTAYDEILRLPQSQPVDRIGRLNLFNTVKDNTRLFGAFVFSSLPRLAAQSLAAESLKNIETAVSRAQAALAEIESAKSEAMVALESVREIAAKTGISTYGGIFGREARDQDKYAWGWFGGTVLVGTAAVIYTHWFFEPYIRGLVDAEKPLSSGVIVSLAISRAILVSLLYMAVIWCIRNFSAARHNAVVNRHRQNALSTFDAFVQAAGGDPQTKSAVLLQATQSIFAPQASGYLKAESDGAAGGPMIEIIRNLTPHKE
jgi:hypothetical protein